MIARAAGVDRGRRSSGSTRTCAAAARRRARPATSCACPRGTKAETQRRLVELQTDWDGYDAYVVAHGERFEDVATTYGISLAQLRKLNGVEHESEIDGGTVLVVPRISADAAREEPGEGEGQAARARASIRRRASR